MKNSSSARYKRTGAPRQAGAQQSHGKASAAPDTAARATGRCMTWWNKLSCTEQRGQAHTHRTLVRKQRKQVVEPVSCTCVVLARKCANQTAHPALLRYIPQAASHSPTLTRTCAAAALPS